MNTCIYMNTGHCGFKCANQSSKRKREIEDPYGSTWHPRMTAQVASNPQIYTPRDIMQKMDKFEPL